MGEFNAQELIELGSKITSLKKHVSTLKIRSEDKLLKKWMDTQEVCLALNISQRTLQTYRDRGYLPYTQVGAKFYYKPKDVENLTSENQNNDYE